MFSNKLFTFFRNNFLIFSILLILQSCGAFKLKRADVKDVPINDAEKRERNIREGRGISIGGGKGRSGSFDFATSNEMWRASLDILDFMPLTSADYGGGLIITDWYSDQGNSSDSIKISIRFLSNEIRADALKIKVFSKQCEITANCKVSQSNPKIENELKVAILKKAAKYKKDIVDSNPKRPLNTILAPGEKKN